MYDIFKLSIMMISSIMYLNLPVNENIQLNQFEKKLSESHYEIFSRFSTHSQKLRIVAKENYEINNQQNLERESNTELSNLPEITENLIPYQTDYVTEAIDESLNLIHATEQVVPVEETVLTNEKADLTTKKINQVDLARPNQVKVIESPFVKPLNEQTPQAVEQITQNKLQNKMTQTLDFIAEVAPQPKVEENSHVVTEEVIETPIDSQPQLVETEWKTEDPLISDPNLLVGNEVETSLPVDEIVEDVTVYDDFRQTYYSVESGEVKVGYGITYDSSLVKNIDNVMHYYDSEYEWLPIVAININEVLDPGFDERGVPRYYGTVIEITYPGGDIMNAIVLDACGACSRDNRIDLWVYSPNIIHDVSGIQYRIVREGFKDEDKAGSADASSEGDATNE